MLPVVSASLLLSVSAITAQSLAGITNKPDTSYSNRSALVSSLKTAPGIQLVTEFTNPDIVTKKNIVYAHYGKREMMIDVFHPSAKPAAPRTAIIMIHGGGWRSGSRSQHYPLMQKLASLGYVCFTPEYRLSTEALFPAAVYDIKEAIRWVRIHAADYGIDTARIAVMGFSAGGEMAAFMATTGNMPLFAGVVNGGNISTKVNALIDLDGTMSFVHPESQEGDDSKKPSAATLWFGYSRKEQPKLWEAASPLSYVSAATPPTLFINSGVARMHAGRDDYRKALEQYNIYTEVHTFEDAPHSFPLFDRWFDPMVGYIDGFLKKVFL